MLFARYFLNVYNNYYIVITIRLQIQSGSYRIEFRYDQRYREGSERSCIPVSYYATVVGAV